MYLQVSSWCQMLAANSLIEANVMVNQPRAAINCACLLLSVFCCHTTDRGFRGFTVNDGYGGNNVVRSNLAVNCVRETSDHGPLNTVSQRFSLLFPARFTLCYI
jgi:hypothetical protein